MRTLSTGEPSTLETYRAMAMVLGGENSKAVRFFDEKIAQSPNGPAEEVIAAESQVVHLILSMIDNDSVVSFRCPPGDGERGSRSEWPATAPQSPRGPSSESKGDRNVTDMDEVFAEFQAEIKAQDPGECTCYRYAVRINADTPGDRVSTRTDYDENCPVHG